MKILHVLNSLGFGGTEIWLLEIIKLNQGEHQFHFLLTGGEQTVFDHEFNRLGCKLFYLKFSRKNAINFVRGINKIVQKEKYDVIHNHEDFVAGWHWLFVFPNLPKIRIAHAHNSNIYIDNYSTGLIRKTTYTLGKILSGILSTKISGTSNQVLNQLGYDSPFYRKKRIEPLYCGVNQTNFSFDKDKRSKFRKSFSFDEENIVVVFVGRIDCPRQGEINHKNPEFALEIAKKTVKSNDNYKFLFVGDKGDLGLQLEKNIKEEGLAENILFLGKRSDINEIMNASDIFLMTSLVEPFGLVLVEAQFSGLKIVSSDIITKEIIEFDELFELQDFDEMDKWVNTILVQKWNVKKREAFVSNNYDKLQKSKFTINSSFNRLLKYYSK